MVRGRHNHLFRLISLQFYEQKSFTSSTHDKSGSVALPRTKLVPAKVAIFATLEALMRPALEVSEVRNRAVAILVE